MSIFEESIGEMLMQAFPQATIKSQYLVKYMGQDLFFDFYLPSINLLVECQGEQHYKYVPHFHGSKAAYKLHAQRDALKREWAKINKIHLYEISYKQQPQNAVQLFDDIYDRMEL